MLVLDENLAASQRQWLRKWRIHFRVIGVDTAAFGTSDENLIPVLPHLPQPTFFSQGAGFFKPFPGIGQQQQCSKARGVESCAESR